MPGIPIIAQRPNPPGFDVLHNLLLIMLFAAACTMAQTCCWCWARVKNGFWSYKHTNKCPCRIPCSCCLQDHAKFGCGSWAGGGRSYIFWTLNSMPFFPDKCRYHWIFKLSGLSRICQVPGLAAEVDPIAHFGRFRSHPTTCTWSQINLKIVAIDKCHSAIT